VPIVPETTAIDVVLLVQIPPGVTSLRTIVEPTQTLVGPVIGATAKEK
jgi:hypothetical protein